MAEERNLTQARGAEDMLRELEELEELEEGDDGWALYVWPISMPINPGAET